MSGIKVLKLLCKILFATYPLTNSAIKELFNRNGLLKNPQRWSTNFKFKTSLKGNVEKKPMLEFL